MTMRSTAARLELPPMRALDAPATPRAIRTATTVTGTRRCAGGCISFVVHPRRIAALAGDPAAAGAPTGAGDRGGRPDRPRCGGGVQCPHRRQLEARRGA